MQSFVTFHRILRLEGKTPSRRIPSIMFFLSFLIGRRGGGSGYMFRRARDVGDDCFFFPHYGYDLLLLSFHCLEEKIILTPTHWRVGEPS